jgi:hypothetical protein
VTGAAELAGALALLLSVGLLFANRISAAMNICTAQVLLCCIAFGASRPMSAAVALLALALSGVAFPLALHRMFRRHPAALVHRATLLLWTAAIPVLVVCVAAFARLGGGNLPALGAAILLTGLLLVARGSNDASRIIGLLSSQNGILLAAGAMPDLPLLTCVLVALPLLPALGLANAWLRS